MLRRLGVFTAGVFLVLALTPFSNFLGESYAPVPQIAPADAIVVLGAGIMYGGALEDESVRRALEGITLHKNGLAPILVFSGKARAGQPQITEAEVRSKLAQDMGIAPEAILKEETANTTREEAIRISRLLMHRGLRKILLVTESLHLRRAKMLFENTGLEVLPAASDSYPLAASSPSGRLWLTGRVMKESAALLYYRIAGFI